MRVIVLAALWLAATGGCARGPGDGGRAPAGGEANHITVEELRRLDIEGMSAWDAVRRLRQTWLHTRGQTLAGQNRPRVVVDGMHYGDLDSLKTLSVSEVQEMWLLSVQDATVRFGADFTGGAILVRTR